MPVRAIASVVWDRRSHDIEVIYVGRDPEHFLGSEHVALALALHAGLTSVPTHEGIRRWVSRC